MKKHLCIASILVFLVGTTAVAAEVLQTLNVSKKAGGSAAAPAMAVNDQRGEVGVVWVRSEPGDTATSEVWFSLLKKKKDGSLKIRKTQKISNSEGLHADPAIVFSDAQNEWLVAWVTSAQPAGGPTPAGLQWSASTARLTAKGKVLALTVLFTLLTTATYSNPYLFALPDTVSPPNPQAAFMLFFGCRGFSGGLFMMYLGLLGQALSQPQQVVAGESYNGQQQPVIPDSIVMSPEGYLLLGLTYYAYSNNIFNPFTRLLKMNLAGVVLFSLILSSSYSSDVQLLIVSQTLLLAAWFSESAGGYVMQRILLASLVFQKKAMQPLRSGLALWYLLFVAMNERLFYMFGAPFPLSFTAPAAEQDMLYQRRIRTKGRPSGKDDDFFDTGGQLRGMTAVGIPSTGKAVIGWLKDPGDGVLELRAVVVNP